MSEELVEQSPRDCFLCHFLGEEAKGFNPEVFEIKSKQSQNFYGLKLETFIIGESHIFRVSKNNIPLMVELLSCVAPQHKGVKGGHVLSFSDSNHHTVALPVGEKPTIFSCADIGAPVEDLYRDANELRFEIGKPIEELWDCYIFPGALKPRTIVRVWLQDNSLIVKSLHEYETLPDHTRLIPLASMTSINIGRIIRNF